MGLSSTGRSVRAWLESSSSCSSSSSPAAAPTTRPRCRWYFGEDTTEFEDGKPAGHAGAWEAGVDGALPGILLPADPEVGMTYRQEYYAGEADDRAKVLSLDESVSVPFGDFTGALQTEDTTPLEPDLVEQKFYVRGIGPVLALR